MRIRPLIGHRILIGRLLHVNQPQEKFKGIITITRIAGSL